jgi:hypothetical protein
MKEFKSWGSPGVIIVIAVYTADAGQVWRFAMPRRGGFATKIAGCSNVRFAPIADIGRERNPTLLPSNRLSFRLRSVPKSLLDSGKQRHHLCWAVSKYLRMLAMMRTFCNLSGVSRVW